MRPKALRGGLEDEGTTPETGGQVQVGPPVVPTRFLLLVDFHKAPPI